MMIGLKLKKKYLPEFINFGLTVLRCCPEDMFIRCFFDTLLEQKFNQFTRLRSILYFSSISSLQKLQFVFYEPYHMINA